MNKEVSSGSQYILQEKYILKVHLRESRLYRLFVRINYGRGKIDDAARSVAFVG